MLKIGEFSKLTQVSIRMLRYYDETGLLKPEQIDKFTSYRLYSASQITTLNKIIFLRDLGFGVTEIADALKHWDNPSIEKSLESKRLEIEETIKQEREKLSKIELAKRDLGLEKISMDYNVTIKSIPSYQVLSLRRIVPDYYSEGSLWEEMSAFAAAGRIPISSNTFTIYHDSDYKEQDVDIEVCASAKRMGENRDGFVFRVTDPVPEMACTMVFGHFKNIAGAYLAFAKWLLEHNQYRMGRHSRQIVHRGPWNEECSENYLTEIQIPLERL